jgi:hypothetical protein
MTNTKFTNKLYDLLISRAKKTIKNIGEKEVLKAHLILDVHGTMEQN